MTGRKLLRIAIGLPSGAGTTIVCMWEIEIVCSDPGYEAELLPLWVEELDEAERAICECGCSVVAVRIAVHEPELPCW